MGVLKHIVRVVAGPTAVAALTDAAAALAVKGMQEVAQRTANSHGEGSHAARAAGFLTSGLERFHGTTHARWELERQLVEEGNSLAGQLRVAVFGTVVNAIGAKPRSQQATLTAEASALEQSHREAQQAERAGEAATAFRLYSYAAMQGHPPAMNDLAFCYLEGIGAQQDKAEGVRWFHRAAQGGYANAQHNLGQCFYAGNGIEANPAEAAYWESQAALQGHAGAQFLTGMFYLKGEGVAPDRAEAERWLKQSAAQGYVDAQAKLGELAAAARTRPAEPPNDTPQNGANPHPHGTKPWAAFELGVKEGADKQAINAAWRSMIRMAHSDHGGDDDFAADLNLARKILLA